MYRFLGIKKEHRENDALFMSERYAIRTHHLQLRRLTLYPNELISRKVDERFIKNREKCQLEER